MRSYVAVLVAILLLPLAVWAALARAGDWPAWRGPQGLGIAEKKGLPVHWSATENVRWKVELPGPGNSTPIVWKSRVWISQATNEGKVRSLMCFNRADGQLLWRKDVAYDKPESTHNSNPYCSASPVTDGERVIVWHGSAGLFAYDLDGNELWSKDLGPFRHVWGNASSPVLYQDLVILSAGPGLEAFVVALDKKTGEEVWRINPPDAVSEKLDEFRGSWSTPVLHTVGRHTELLLSLPLRLVSYDPATGEELWRCEGLSKLAYTSPLAEGDIVVAMSGYHGPALAARTGGSGDVTDTHRLWLHEKKIPQRVGSGVLVGGYVYILNEPGIAWCLDAKTGEKKWEQRVGTGSGRSWSSMCYADGRLYVITMNGETIVLEPTPEACKIIAQNPLEETTRASLAFSDGQIFIRTYNHLHCIEAAQR